MVGGLLAVILLPGWYWWTLLAIILFAVAIAVLAAAGVPWAKRIDRWLRYPKA